MTNAETIGKLLKEWFAEHGRRFPWRNVKDPYRVMVVEFLLQRTKAETVKKIYNEIFRRFPDINTLAAAENKEIEDIFSRLGLLYRAAKLVNAAKAILENHQGRVPCNAKMLLELDGVGAYIMSAVLNFGCAVPTPVVDKNVMRVANRLWGVERESEARKLIEKLYNYGDHDTIAYALIDLGALICMDKPHCGICPLNDVCPKLPIQKEKWRMLRKVKTATGKALKEQPITKLSKR
jgi:A/G-specific adenine glycosylase